MILHFANINGKEIPVRIQKISGQHWLHLNGKTFIYEKEQGNFETEGENKEKTDQRANREGRNDFYKKNGRQNRNEKSELNGKILSPMPGKITKVYHQIGDKVVKGAPLIVLEAMKMEYTLKADRDGCIESLYAQTGEQVPLGMLLIKIK